MKKIITIIKSKLLTLLLLMITTIAIKGQEFHVETPGTLQEVIGDGAEDLTYIKVTGTLNNQDIDFLHHLCWPLDQKAANMKADDYLKMSKEKEDSSRTNLRYLDLEDARMVNDALPDNAFAPSYLYDIKLPKNLKKIGKNALGGNVLLKELIIPESVEEIGEMLLYYSTKIEKVRLPDNLEVLNRALFSNCWNLKEVNVPSKLRVLHDGVFESCPDINRSVTKLPETLEIWDGTPYTGYEWFQEIVVPKNVKILQNAFFNMLELRKVTILTEKLTEIGFNTFFNCTSLEELYIPRKITRIGEGAFYGCSRLKKINIPSTVTRIEKHAFERAPLETIDIPAGVSFIGKGAFGKNKNLKILYSRPITPPSTTEWTEEEVKYLPFQGSSAETAILYIPKGTATAYRTSEVFSCFKNIVELEEWQWPSSISGPNITSDSFKVYGKDGKLNLEIEGDMNSVSANVYTIDGRSVWNGRVTNHVEIQLPKGLYVVRSGLKTYKISL